MLYIALALGVIFALAYTALIFFKKNNELYSWLHSFFSTLCSILVGLSVAIWMINYQEEAQDNSKKEQLETLLIAELSSIKGALTKKDYFEMSFEDGSSIKIHMMYIEPTAIKEAATSGLYDLKSSNQLLELVQSIGSYNQKNKALFDAFSSDLPSNQKKDLLNSYHKCITSVITGLLQKHL